ncbi:hypothetical protein STA3757_00640 [Stanieria sp. NIES-3757]|nr:hypothetical protein STA3757_00640 [Stanieria sp. NIES-3757]
MVEWSKAFGNIPIYIHEKDRDWVTRRDNSITFWQGKTHQLNRELTLINCGGHFAGGTVLHWGNGAEGKGILLSGDIIQVVADCRYVSFMYSYPNLIPMSAEQVDRIVEAVEPFAFDCIYSAFTHREVTQDAKEALHRSATRYKQAIEGEWSPAISPNSNH